MNRARQCTPHKGNAVVLWYEQAAQLPDDWDSVLPHNHYLQRSTLAVHEGTRLAHISHLYVRIILGKAILLQACFQLLHIESGHVSSGTLKGWRSKAWQLFCAATRPRLLVAGNLFRHDVSSVWTAAESFEVFQQYQQVLWAAIRRSKAGALLVKDPPAAFVPYFRNYAPEYLLLRNDISMHMAMQPEWETLKDYEKSLKHKYAQRFRKVRQAFAGVQIRALSADEVAAQAGVIHRLYRQVSDHQPVRLGSLNDAFLPALKHYYKDVLSVWGFYEEDQMIAFATAWTGGQELDMFYIGFDYGRNGPLQLYFNILFFAAEQAIVLKKSALSLGRTALEAKARVGCRPVYLHTFLYVRNPILRNLVARAQQRFLGLEGEWENRHPFK